MKNTVLFFLYCFMFSSFLEASSHRLVSINIPPEVRGRLEKIKKPFFRESHAKISSYISRVQQRGNPKVYDYFDSKSLSKSFISFSRPWHPFLFYFCNPESLMKNESGFPRCEEEELIPKRKRKNLSLFDYDYSPHYIGISVLKDYLKKKDDYTQRLVSEREETSLSLYQYDLFDRKLYSVLDQINNLSLVSDEDSLKGFSKKFNVAMSFHELALYFIKIDKSIGKKSDRLFISYPDISGLPIRLFYQKGVLSKATVEDFGKSYDILDIVRQNEIIPKIISHSDPFVACGKVYLTSKDILAINNRRYENGLRLWVDSAFCISHALKNMYDPENEIVQRVKYVFDDISGFEKFSTYQDVLKCLSENSFPVLKSEYIFKGDMAFLYNMLTVNGIYPFDIRGKKIRLFDYSEEKLISENKSIIFLIEPNIISSKVKNVSFNVLVNGVVSACIEVDQFIFEKKRYSRFFISNLSQFYDLDIHQGDQIQIVCNANKKPYIYKSLANGSGKQYHFPENCPQCESLLCEEHFNGDISLKCAAHLVCKNLNEPLIHQFVSPSGFNIKSFTPIIINQMIRSFLLADVSDIFDLSISDLHFISDEEKIKQFLYDIENSKRIKLGNFIYALCIPNLTPLMANGLAHSLGTLEKIKNVTQSQLVKLNFLDSQAVQSILEFFKDKQKLKEIEKILSKKVVITEYNDDVLSLCYKDKKHITQKEYQTMLVVADKTLPEFERSDEDYDMIVDCIRDIEAVNPKWKKERKSTQHAKKVVTVKDCIKVHKTYNKESFRKMLQNNADFQTLEILPKINGVACSIVFHNGFLTNAYTKGSRSSAMDVTGIVKKIPSLSYDSQDDFSGIIRGELFLFRDGLKRINNERIRSGLNPYLDGLSAVVSAVNKSHINSTMVENLQFYGFAFSGFEGVEETLLNGNDVATFLKNKRIGYTKLYPKNFTNVDDALAYATDSFSRRFEMEMDIDGMVARIHRNGHSIERYGYKFDVERKNTKILGISSSISKSGKLIIIAEIEPLTFENGRTIKRIYVEDHTLFDKEPIGQNDVVSVQFIGGIKATIIGTIKSKKDSTPFIFPVNCPQCSRALTIKQSGNRVCENILCKRSHPVNKDIINFIKSIEVVKHDNEFIRIVESIIDNGIIKRKKDLFLLDIETLRNTCSLSSQEVSLFFGLMDRIKTLTPLEIILACKEGILDQQNAEKVLDLCDEPSDVLLLNQRTLTQNNISPNFARGFLKLINREKENLQEIFKHLIPSVPQDDIKMFSIDTVEEELELQRKILKDIFEKDFKKLQEFLDEIDEKIKISHFTIKSEDFQRRKDFITRVKRKKEEFKPLIPYMKKYISLSN